MAQFNFTVSALEPRTLFSVSPADLTTLKQAVTDARTQLTADRQAAHDALKLDRQAVKTARGGFKDSVAALKAILQNDEKAASDALAADRQAIKDKRATDNAAVFSDYKQIQADAGNTDALALDLAKLKTDRAAAKALLATDLPPLKQKLADDAKPFKDKITADRANILAARQSDTALTDAKTKLDSDRATWQSKLADDRTALADARAALRAAKGVTAPPTTNA